MGLERSEHRMGHAAVATKQVEKLQQVAKGKMLLEMEYVTRERYARFAALNTRQESGTKCTQDRASNNDDDDDSIGEAAPARFCLSEYVLRPTGRRNSQEQVQTDGLLQVEAYSRL